MADMSQNYSVLIIQEQLPSVDVPQASLRVMEAAMLSQNASPLLHNDTRAINPALEVVHICLTSITVVLIYLGNLLMVAVILRYRWFHCPQGVMLFSIALADLVIGTDSLLGMVALTGNESLNFSRGCAILGYATSVSITVNVLTIALLSFDRWLLIHKPFRYSNIMTTTRATVAAILIWVVSFLVYVAYFFQWFQFHYIVDSLQHICIVDVPTHHQNILVMISIPAIIGLGVILTFALLTCRIAHNHALQIHAHDNLVQRAEEPRNQNSGTSASTKYIRTTLLIILAFLVTWLPLHILQLLMALNIDVKMPPVIMYILGLLLVSNSYINSIICITTDSRFVKGIKLLVSDMMKCTTCCDGDMYNVRARGRQGSMTSTHITTIA